MEIIPPLYYLWKSKWHPLVGTVELRGDLFQFKTEEDDGRRQEQSLNLTTGGTAIMEHLGILLSEVVSFKNILGHPPKSWKSSEDLEERLVHKLQPIIERMMQEH